MGKFEGQNVGLREKDTDKIIAVYPEVVNGTDQEINKTVRDWFYKQACANEDILRTAYVDVIEDVEMK